MRFSERHKWRWTYNVGLIVDIVLHQFLDIFHWRSGEDHHGSNHLLLRCLRVERLRREQCTSNFCVEAFSKLSAALIFLQTYWSFQHRYSSSQSGDADLELPNDAWMHLHLFCLVRTPWTEIAGAGTIHSTLCGFGRSVERERLCYLIQRQEATLTDSNSRPLFSRGDGACGSAESPRKLDTAEVSLLGVIITIKAADVKQFTDEY